MNIFCIGDIVSAPGRRIISEKISDLIKEKKIDLVIANGENVSHGRGMTKKTYDEMSYYIDAFTLGNHTWGCHDIIPILENSHNVIRPLNFNSSAPGYGSMIVQSKTGYNVGIINIIGQVYMDPVNSPFDSINNEIEKIKSKTNIIIVDFHAEATSEKRAMGYYLDGKVSVVFGTHTHIQTADEEILEGGTGYITDLGMTGPQKSILGMQCNIIIDRFKTAMPQKFIVADGPAQLCGCIFEINETTGKCVRIERVFIRE